jgi:hypothetical protein
MTLNVLRFVSVTLTAVAMAGGVAHLLELPNKIGLSREDYRTVQQIYRGWALLGIAVTGALVSTAALAVQVRHRPAEFYLVVAAAPCIALSLIVFFVFTFPANRQTANWTAVAGELAGAAAALGVLPRGRRRSVLLGAHPAHPRATRGTGGMTGVH